jgi:hypothetical protein
MGELEYPLHDRTITVTQCGRICIGRRKINLSQVFAGQNVGIKEFAVKIWLVIFIDYDLGFFDHETGRVLSMSREEMDSIRPGGTQGYMVGVTGFEPATPTSRKLKSDFQTLPRTSKTS